MNRHGPILALEKISKRFGAVVVADGIDLSLAEGEALGIIGPNGAGKTTLFGIATGTVGPTPAASCSTGPTSPRCRRSGAAAWARAFVPDSAAVRRHDGVREPRGRGGVRPGQREHEVYAGCVDILDRCGLADKANRLAAPLTLIDRKRLELARALATKPRVLLLDEVAGGLTEPECASLVALIKEVRATGVSIVWIEHVVHALTAVVDRLVVLHAGAIIAEGEPNAVISSPQVARNLSRDRGRCLSPCWKSTGSTPSTATSRRCSASRSKSRRRRVVAVIGANGAGKTTLLSIRALMSHAARRQAACRFDGDVDRRRPPEAIARLGASLTPEGRRAVPVALGRGKPADRRADPPRRPLAPARVYELFPVLAELRRLPATALSGGQQQMVAIGRALLVNPRVLACDEISLGLAPKVVGDIYRILPEIRDSGVAIRLVEQDVARARAASDHFYCLLEGRVALSGAAGALTRDAISAAYFGVLRW